MLVKVIISTPSVLAAKLFWPLEPPHSGPGKSEDGETSRVRRHRGSGNTLFERLHEGGSMVHSQF